MANGSPLGIFLLPLRILVFWLRVYGGSRFGVAEMQIVTLGFHPRWESRYYVSGNYDVEKKGYSRVIYRLQFEGPDVTRLLCQVHYDRKIRMKFAGNQYEQLRQHLIIALWYRKTEAGPMESLAAALHLYITQAQRVYLERCVIPKTW